MTTEHEKVSKEIKILFYQLLGAKNSKRTHLSDTSTSLYNEILRKIVYGEYDFKSKIIKSFWRAIREEAHVQLPGAPTEKFNITTSNEPDKINKYINNLIYNFFHIAELNMRNFDKYAAAAIGRLLKESVTPQESLMFDGPYDSQSKVELLISNYEYLNESRIFTVNVCSNILLGKENHRKHVEAIDNYNAGSIQLEEFLKSANLIGKDNGCSTISHFCEEGGVVFPYFWGSIVWNMLHFLAELMLSEQRDDCLEDWKQFLALHLANILPCTVCSDHWEILMKSKTDMLENLTVDTIPNTLYQLHNEVSKERGQDEFSLEEFENCRSIRKNVIAIWRGTYLNSVK